jgi:predicted ATPase
MGVSAPIAMMSGSELQRSFLLSLQEWHKRNEEIDALDVSKLDDAGVERLVRDTLVMQGNLAAVAAKCAVELGLPI